VSIGGLPAWRALPKALGAAVEAASNAADALMKTPLMTPVDAKLLLANVDTAVNQAAAAAAAEGNAAAVATTTAALQTLRIADAALTATWTAASAAPGGQPAASQGYTTGLQAATAAAASAVFSAIGAMFDTHACATPMGHGPGLVTVGSGSVSVNNLPLARQGDVVMEAAGGANPIAMGCALVSVG
jgi:uncharacterized Zn-binding protein involved in type VI secretion